MTRKIAVINDLSGFGRCSLTAAIPAIAAGKARGYELGESVCLAQKFISAANPGRKDTKIGTCIRIRSFIT